MRVSETLFLACGYNAIPDAWQFMASWRASVSLSFACRLCNLAAFLLRTCNLAGLIICVRGVLKLFR